VLSTLMNDTIIASTICKTKNCMYVKVYFKSGDGYDIMNIEEELAVTFCCEI